MKTLIEEGIYDVETRMPLRKAVVEYDGKRVLRNLFIFGDSKERNDRMDVLDLSDASSEKERLDRYKEQVDNEIPFFECPIINSQLCTVIYEHSIKQ